MNQLVMNLRSYCNERDNASPVRVTNLAALNTFVQEITEIILADHPDLLADTGVFMTGQECEIEGQTYFATTMPFKTRYEPYAHDGMVSDEHIALMKKDLADSFYEELRRELDMHVMLSKDTGNTYTVHYYILVLANGVQIDPMTFEPHISFSYKRLIRKT